MMYMKIYDASDGQVVAEGDVSTGNSGIASRSVIDLAVAAGYDVEFQGFLYCDPNGESGRLARAEILSEDEDARALA